ncbi:MAG: MopE-related protein [Myxococcota bacterium]
MASRLLPLLGLLALLAACSTTSTSPGVSYWNPDGTSIDVKDTKGDGIKTDGVDPGDTATPSDVDEDTELSDATEETIGDPSLNEDHDQDGFTPAQGDCDDGNPKVNPKAKESCNLLDDDCNGQTDDRDNDGDGFSSCPGPFVDCDDGNKTVFPGAKPDCSTGLDHDCDGQIDAEQDDDKDGVFACNDCDDKDPAVFPGAPTQCSGTKDYNCDGVLDALFDGDSDGVPGCKDCNDGDAAIHQGAFEVCNQIDDDCNGITDDKDDDGDGWSGCSDDCNDADITINPIASRNCLNGKDNDCSGTIDAQEDGDKDGYAGCSDCNDYNPFVNPGALEYGADLVDNNCSGQTDEAPVKCDNAALNSANTNDYAPAADICYGVVQSTFPVVASASARAIRTSFGPANTAHLPPNFVVLSSGVAAAKGQAGYVSPQQGTAFSNSAPYPNVSCKNSGTVYDYTEWKLVLKVPTNAQAFSFDFNFMSSEYPEWVGTQYNDKFLAVMDSQKFKGNISFDANGNCISINNALFSSCTGCKLGDAELQGTGYEGGIGGGTGWLTTTSPVTPGETITLRFIVFDEGDHILDSVVLIDAFRWHAKAAAGGPSTVRPG